MPYASKALQGTPYGGVHPHTVTWSPDNKYLAFSTDNNQVRIWDIANQKLVYTYTEHKSPVLAVAWSPDGSRIASAGVDETVHVWTA